MPQVREVLPPHHKVCDDFFSAAEVAAHEGNWSACAEAFENFSRSLLVHFDAEETLLFPAFENATGMRQGPTQVMRMEHGQMRDLVGQLSAALAAKDADTFGGVAETLLILMQQHNMKEENILYPMCDQTIGAQGDGKLDQLVVDVSSCLESAECPIRA